MSTFNIEIRNPGSGFNISLASGGVSTAGYIKYWNGSSWALKPVKYWNGSSWVQKPVKYWTGSVWSLA